MIQIKRNNKVFFTLEDFGEGSKLSYQLMDHHYIILKFTTATPIYFEIGDSVEIPDFGYFELTSSYFPKHNDSDGYDYEMQMDAYYMSWKNKICKYRPQHGANETSFNLTTTVGVHMNVILGNLKALGLTYNGKDFSVDYTTYNNKAFDVQKRFLIEYGSISILDALNVICSEDALNCEWWIDGSIIYLGYCEMEGQTTFEQDVNVLSMSYSESKSTYITRLYAFGSDRNIPKGYFTGADADVTTDGVATDYLMLPNKEVDSDGFYAKDGYLENVNVVKNDKQAIEGVVMFEDECPKIESVVSSIKTYDSTVDNDDGTKTTQTFWQVTATDSFATSFKESWKMSNLTLGIKFTSGALMGMEFDVSFKTIDEVNYFEIVSNDTYGRTLPDGVMCPKIGDKFFLFNWDATKITDTDLIPTAQLSLFDRAKQYYQKTMISNSNFTCTMDGDKFYNDGTYDYHPLGEQVKLINDMFAQVDADGKHYRNSRIIGMEIPLDIPYDHPQYTVGEKAATSRLGKLEDKVDSITVNGMQIGGTGSGNGSGVYVIGLNDSTPASDSNIYSARRSRMEFIHRLTDDTAKGTITWEKVQKFLQGLNIGDGNSKWSADGTLILFRLLTNNFSSGLYGQGAQIDEKGNIEANSIYARQFISAPKFVFNEISVTKAEQWNTNGYGTIESVDVENRTITLHLEENDYGSLQVGDICRGLYADIDNAHGADKIEEGALDDCNFVQHKGFFSTYFYVTHIITSEKGKFVFQYGKKSSVTPDPCAYMDFAQYGSFTDEKRQSSMYFSSRGNSYIEVLDGVCTWEVQPQNRVARYGWLGGLALVKKDGSIVRPEGNGIYVQDNIYFGGNINYLQGLSGLDDLREEAKAYDVSLSQYQSVITVDDMGNVINGLYTEDEEKTTKQYRISTAVFVRKGMDILLEEDGNTEDVTAGHYRVHAVSEDCEVMVQNSTIFVTAIRNIKDGVAGTNDDANFDYDAMRKATDAMVTIVVELEGKTSKMVQMPIRIQHDTLPFMVCDLSNESASVAWNTKTAKYIGLPIKTKVSLMYHNEPWAISSLNISKVAGLKTSMSIEGKAKVITIDADNLTADTLAQVTKMNITVVGRYAGANYEYTRELTILKSSDTVVYELIPSADSIVVDKDGNKTVNSVSCDVYATSSDDKRYKLTALPAGMSLKYGKSENATTSVGLGTAVSVSADDKMVTFALYDSSNNMLDKESVPMLAYGKDGKGIEYIFKLQNSAPSNPTPSGYATNTEYQRTDKEYIPSGWTDDPTGVDAVNQYEWVCKRVSTNGHWGAFSEPAEYAHFGKHAPKAKSSDDIVTIPTDSKGMALVAFRESIQFQLLVDGLSCTLTSVTIDSSTLSDVSCSISSNVANISCAEGANLGTTAQTIVFRVAGRLSDGSSYSDYVTVKVVPNVTGADGDGYEYIYYLSSSSSASSIPTPRRQNGILQDNWQDDPMPPTVDKQYVYVAYKKGVVGSNGTFSTPKLFNRFPKSISKQETKFYTTSSLSPAPEAWKIWNYGSTSMPTDFNDSFPWLWKIVRTTYTDGTTDDVVSCEGYKAKDGTDGAPGAPGESGAPGVGIDSIQTYYLISSKSSEITTSSSGWETSMVNPTSSKPYLWSYVKTTLSNGDITSSTPVIIGNFAEAGVMGAIGCIIRPSIWKSGVVYLNESALTNKQEKYIDLVYVEDASANDGWRQYMCALTHTSSSNNSPTSSGGSKYWTQLSDTGPIYAPLILAKNAVLNFTQGQQFNLVENGKIFASYRIPGSDGAALWLGGSTASSAPFSVDKNGSLKSTSGIIGGVEISQERLGVGVADVGNKTFKGAILSSEGIFTGYKSSYFGAGVFAADDPSGDTIQMYDQKALGANPTQSVSSPSLYVRKYSPDSIILNDIDKYYGAALIVDVPKGVGVASLGNNVLGGLALSAVAGDLDIGSTDYLFQKNRGTVAYLTNSSGRRFYLPDNPHEGQVVIVIQGSTGNITFYHPGKRLVIQNTVKDSGGFYSGKQGQFNIFVYIGSMWYGTYSNG